MRPPTLQRQVENRINEDAAIAKQIATRMCKRGASISDDDISQFFPELGDRVKTGQWSNLPSRFDLLHYLIIGHTPVLER